MATRMLLATANSDKVDWLRNGLAGVSLPVEPSESHVIQDVDEDGVTCEDNAWIKARAIPESTSAVVVAEDSGLFVDALNGSPGTRAARWSSGTDDDRARCLLGLLKGIEASERSARFVSAIAVRFPDGQEVTVRGELEGRITTEPGKRGAGYGGVFKLSDGRLLGETSGVGGHRISALRKATEAILSWLAG